MNETSTIFPEQPAWQGDGTHHIPFLASMVRRLDPVEGVLVIAPPEGLLDL